MTELLLNLITILLAAFTLVLVLTVIVFLFVTRIPYVPSRTGELEQYFREHKPARTANFYDLGCGDGRVLLLAERHGLQATGFEIAPLPWLLAHLKRLLFRSKMSVRFRNFLNCDLSPANYIYCYLFPELTEKAFQKAKRECQSGSWFICDTFSLKSVQPLHVYHDHRQKPKLFIYQI